MLWKGQRQSENVEDRRGMSGGGLAIGGGLGGIVLLVIALLLGADPRQLLETARRLRDIGKHHHRGATEIRAHLLFVDVVGRVHTPGRRQHRDRTLHVDPDVSGVHRDGEGLGGREARLDSTSGGSLCR